MTSDGQVLLMRGPGGGSVDVGEPSATGFVPEPNLRRCVLGGIGHSDAPGVPRRIRCRREGVSLERRRYREPSLKYLLLLLMLQPLAAFGDADTSTVMHRIFAGTFDASGWAVAESTNGAFSVKMPGPFNDFSVAGNPSDLTARVEGIAGKAPNGITFTALKQVYKVKGTASAQFDTFKDGGGLPGATVRP